MAVVNVWVYEEEWKCVEVLVELDCVKIVFFFNVSYEFCMFLILMLGLIVDLLNGVGELLLGVVKINLEVVNWNV